MLYYLLNLLNTINNISPILINKVYQKDFDKKRKSYYDMSPVYSPIALFSSLDHIIDNIYLGSSYNASDRDLLKENKIKNIINTTTNIPNFYEQDNIKYLNIEISDNGEESYTREQLDRSYDFILNSLHDDENIFIHCVFGRSRSVTIILYYLIKRYNYSIEEALNIIKSRRYCINPSIRFIDNLKEIYNL